MQRVLCPLERTGEESGHRKSHRVLGFNALGLAGGHEQVWLERAESDYLEALVVPALGNRHGTFLEPRHAFKLRGLGKLVVLVVAEERADEVLSGGSSALETMAY